MLKWLWAHRQAVGAAYLGLVVACGLVVTWGAGDAPDGDF